MGFRAPSPLWDRSLTDSEIDLVNLGDDEALQFGASQDASLLWETADADAHYLNLTLGTSRNFIISEDGGVDWGHATQTNPTLWIHSADATDVNDYVSLAHNQTDGLLRVGTGSFDLNALMQWSKGQAITGSDYQIGRNADATNRLQLNVPTGTAIEMSVNDAAVGLFNANGLSTNLVSNVTSIANARLGFLTTGSYFVRDIADANVTLIVDNLNAGSTGDILELRKASVPVLEVSTNGSLVFPAGGAGAIVATNYEIRRDSDGTNQLHLNVPTGASFELSVNDVAQMTLSATAVDFLDNSITSTGGGSLTGTWSDLGTVTTVDINGGTIDGATIGGAVAGAITGTTITATSFVIGANTIDTNEWAFLDGLNQSVATTSNPTFGNLTITSFAANWTNAGRTVADLGIVTTADINGGTIDGVTIGGSVAGAGTFTTLIATNGADGVLNILQNEDSANAQVARLGGRRSGVAANDKAYISMELSDDGGNQTEFARMAWEAADVTDASEDGRLDFHLMKAGTLTDMLVLNGTEFRPHDNDVLSLGTATTSWADFFLASGGVINWDNGDVTITHAANALTFAGATSGYTFSDGDIIVGADRFIQYDVNGGITASTTQTQGQQPLTAQVNVVGTVANTNDTVTLVSAVTGYTQTIINNGANTLQIFPASGDNLGAGTNNPTTLAAGSNVTFVAVSAGLWEII